MPHQDSIGSRFVRIKWIAVFLVTVTLLVLALTIARHCIPGERLETVDWVGLQAQCRQLLEQNDFEEVHAFERWIEGTESTPDDALAFAQLCVDCAQARREGMLGDTHFLLARATEALNTLSPSVEVVDTVYRLASEYEHLRLYRQVFEELARLPEDALPDEARPLKDNAQQILVRVHGSNSPTLSASVEERVQDLLTAIPENPWYDEKALLDLKTGLREVRVEPALPILLAEPGEAMPREKQTRLKLTPTLKQDLLELITREGALKSNVTGHPTVQRLANMLKKGEYDEGEFSLVQVLTHDPHWVLVFQSSDFILGTNAVVLLTPSSSGQLQATQFNCYGLEEVGFIETTGDTTPELLLTGRQGSGGFLDGDLIDLRDHTLIWSAVGLYHGNLSFLDLDDDPAMELVTLEATGERFVDCNQCPSTYTAQVFDYDHATDLFRLKGELVTSAEMMVRTHGNLMGMSPGMMTSVLDFERNTQSLLMSLRERPSSQWTEEDLQSLTGIFQNYILGYLVKSFALESAARELTNIVEALQGESISEPWLYLRAHVQSTRVEVALMRGTGEEAVEAALEPWFEQFMIQDDDLRIHYVNMRGLAHLLSGQLDQGFLQFERARNLTPEPVPEVLGNLAWYYRLVDDTESARRYALEAIDAAYRLERRSLVNLLHMASVEATDQNPKRALDWALRSIRQARSGTSGGLTALNLYLGAQVALDQGAPKLALRLLDESIVTSDRASWHSQGGAILLAYAQALLALGQDDAAQRTLRAASKLADAFDSGTVIEAQYLLSKSLDRQGKRDEAVSAAWRAFKKVVSGRQRIGQEFHKLSFLERKRQAVEWLLHLLMQEKANVEQIFDVVESWKMQSFLDVYGGSPGMAPTVAVDSLRSTLKAGDVFVEYFIGDEVAFAVVVPVGDEMKLVPLSCRRGDLDRMNEEFARHVNLRNPDTLNQIRRNRIPESLTLVLQELQEQLIGPLSLSASAQRLVIAPDECMLPVPWPALWFPDTSYFLASRFLVTLIPSAGVGMDLMQRAHGHCARDTSCEASPSALVVAVTKGVDKEELAPLGLSKTLPELQEGEKEWQEVSRCLETWCSVKRQADSAIQARFPDCETAVPPATLRAMEDSNIVHVVAHGAYNRYAPMQSALFLEKGDEGRILRPLDVVGHDLSCIELLTLAACESGIVAGRAGAEPVGFQRGFLGAGAQRLLSVNWEIDDHTAREMFTEMYSQLPAASIDEALRNAQGVIRTRNPHPYFWSGFSLTGNWRAPVVSKNSSVR